jgi:hypothetical protein
MLGDKKNAYDVLMDLDSTVFPGHIFSLMLHDPNFDNLRGDEEFKNIVLHQQEKFAALRAELRKRTEF